MKTEQTRWTASKGWTKAPGQLNGAQLVYLLGGTKELSEGKYMPDLKKAYPSGVFVGCSTAGEIAGTSIYDDSLVSTAVEFGHTKIKTTQVTCSKLEESFAAAKTLAKALAPAGLTHIMV